MIFIEEERIWIDTKTFGWPIKEGCPESIRKSIEEKKKKINEQMDKKNDKILR
jgi:hypothetical protein